MFTYINVCVPGRESACTYIVNTFTWLCYLPLKPPTHPFAFLIPRASTAFVVHSLVDVEAMVNAAQTVHAAQTVETYSW